MKKTRTTRSLLAAVSVVALTAALYGCSGSDGGGGSQTGTPSGPTQDEQVAALQAEINALRAQLGLAPDASLGDSVAFLQAEVKRLRDEAQARMDAEQAAKDKERAAEARALALAVFATPSFIGFDDQMTVTATYGEQTTVTPNAATGFFADANIVEPDFKPENSRSLGTRSGWSGTELMSTAAGGTVTDVVHVYSNIKPDERAPFAEWASATTGVTWANGVVTVAPGNSAFIEGAAFATDSGSKAHELNVNTDADADGELFQTPGTFAGAPGTYTCSGGTSCTSSVASDDGGVILGGEGSPTWTFTPDSGGTAAVADPGYVSFGWWLRKTDEGYAFNPFHATTGAEFNTDLAITALAGTATYTGFAAGVYSIYDSGPKAGHFTADVELKADFGNASELGTITGTVTSFSDRDGMEPAGMDTWKVTLPEDDFIANGVQATGDGDERPVWMIDGETGGPASNASRWVSRLREPDDGGTPQGITGVFRVQYGVVGNMRGAFGATRSGP